MGISRNVEYAITLIVILIGLVIASYWTGTPLAVIKPGLEVPALISVCVTAVLVVVSYYIIKRM